ncbi:glycosyltransferase family 2 protein [Paraconexibacter sp.]|uniref:glycosyltransferase family 2 protein n=1 Tax=Paraconexibacter sp. TaxID=2949640 RepID=UPI003569DC29
MSGTCTILVLSVDEASLLEDCLPAAVAQPDAEVVVIDNACVDGTRAVAERHGARVIGLPQRRSYAAAINAGLAATNGDAVLLLNADCVLDAGFLDAARPQLERDGVGSVAPRLVRASGMAEADRLDVLDAAGMTFDRRRKNSLVAHGRPVASRGRRGPAFGGDGACVLYRREVLEDCAVGAEVLDEDMELWASDADLAWRAQRLGWSCTYEPAAIAWHVRFYSPTTRAELPPEHRTLQFRNRLLMIVKNDDPGDLVRDLPRLVLYEILALGFAVLRERHLLAGYLQAWRLLPAARRRRAAMAERLARRGGARPVPFGLEPPRS